MDDVLERFPKLKKVSIGFFEELKVAKEFLKERLTSTHARATVKLTSTYMMVMGGPGNQDDIDNVEDAEDSREVENGVDDTEGELF